MPSDEQSYECSLSTTWTWRKVKIARAPQASRPSAPKGRRWFRLPARDPRERLVLKVHYRGGPECWYQVEARGSMGRFPGHVALHDVMREINRAP